MRVLIFLTINLIFINFISNKCTKSPVECKLLVEEEKNREKQYKENYKNAETDHKNQIKSIEDKFYNDIHNNQNDEI